MRSMAADDRLSTFTSIAFFMKWRNSELQLKGESERNGRRSKGGVRIGGWFQCFSIGLVYQRNGIALKKRVDARAHWGQRGGAEGGGAHSKLTSAGSGVWAFPAGGSTVQQRAHTSVRLPPPRVWQRMRTQAVCSAARRRFQTCVVIRRSARSGGLSISGGSPSHISITVMPKLHTSTYWQASPCNANIGGDRATKKIGREEIQCVMGNEEINNGSRRKPFFGGGLPRD